MNLPHNRREDQNDRQLIVTSQLFITIVQIVVIFFSILYLDVSHSIVKGISPLGYW